MTKKSRVAKAVAKSKTIKAAKPAEPVVNVPDWTDSDDIPFTTKWQPTRYVNSQTVITRYVLVTPHIAAQMMTYNIDNNRRIDPRTVTQYAEAMANKEWWWQAWMPIHFSDEARLINGQHRLSGIIESGVSLPCMIVYNVPKEAVRGIDAGKKRTIAQQITLQGRDTKNAEVTIARYILGAHGEGGSLTYSGPVSAIEQFVVDYDRSVKFAMQHLPITGPGAVKVPGKGNRRLGLISGAVQAAFAQAHAVAWLHNNTRMIGDIAEFARQLMAAGEMIATGDMSQETADELEVSEAAQKLATFLLIGSGAGTRADSNRDEKYRKTVWVLRRYLDGEDFVRVNEARSNVFELPIQID